VAQSGCYRECVRALAFLAACWVVACTTTSHHAGSEPAPLTEGGSPAAATRATATYVAASPFLPARIRRLANAEYDATVRKLLSTSTSPASKPDFPPDFRQGGFTVNDAQRIDAVLVERLAAAADRLATEAQQNGTLARLAPCRHVARARSCARAFIKTFGPKVYRRPLADGEIRALLALYDVGAEGATYTDGVTHVLRGLLQSAGLLYVTELGDPRTDPKSDPERAVTLTPYEIASSLSYFLTSAPPDDELLAKAVAGALYDPAEREAEARRLLRDDPLAQQSVVRLVREWLGIDRIERSSKDTLVYPEFPDEKPKIVAESHDFVAAVAFRASGTVSELLDANWTVDSGPLALYDIAGEGPIAGTTRVDRVGILNQAAFLATYANAHESHPVFRGVAIARRVACLKLDSPTAFDIIVVPPVPDPRKTTRERFRIHSQDSLCQICHSMIDPFGFSFEHFDGIGAFRSRENGRLVDSSVVVKQRAEYDGPYADSNALAAALAQSDSVRACFARFMFRAGAATGDPAAGAAESQFLDEWRATPAAAQGNIVETLVAFVKRPGFTQRRTP
jgi:Protein of unknown function (DUF1592)/Protein of unknown function (DUF1588)/Protein of unknown function (DUF1595)/Protein of unknown function (DUF1587)